MDKRDQLSDTDSNDIETSRDVKHLKVDDGPEIEIQVEDWMPREVKSILEVENIEVRVVYGSNFEGIAEDLTESKSIGLTVLGEPGKIPLAICFTSIKKIYVFQTSVQHLIFLNQQLRRKELFFFTANGVFDSLSLNLCSIKLGHNVIDLQAFDMQQFFIRHTLRSQQSITYGLNQLDEKLKIPTPNLNQLVNLWLDVELDLDPTSEEINSFGPKLPYDVAALNLIKKQAALIRCLGLAMKNSYKARMREPSKEIFSLAKRADSSIREQYDQKGSRLYSDLVNILGLCPLKENPPGKKSFREEDKRFWKS